MKGEYISIETLRIMQDLEKENKELQNIIKEAKEYVYKMFNTEPANSREYDYHCGKLAEILDRSEK